MITAGHCTDFGVTWRGADRVVIGTVASNNFPTTDFGTLDVDTTAWTPTGQVNGLPRVTGSAEVPVGASVCRSGATTGVRCGQVISRNVTVNYSGKIIYGLVRSSACAQGGDSGGSVTSGDQAQGVTSGASGTCATGGSMVYQPITPALNTLRLTLATDWSARAARGRPLEGVTVRLATITGGVASSEVGMHLSSR